MMLSSCCQVGAPSRAAAFRLAPPRSQQHRHHGAHLQPRPDGHRDRESCHRGGAAWQPPWWGANLRWTRLLCSSQPGWLINRLGAHW